MRKYITIIVLAILSLSCAKENSAEVSNGKEKTNFDVFAIYGEVHNDLLKYASDNFVETKSITNISDGINYILQLQQYGVERLNISESNKEALKFGLEYFKNLYVTDNIHKMISARTRVTEENEEITTNDIKQLIYDAYISNEIDMFEFNSFNELIDCVVANAQGLIGTEEFETKINSLISSWEIKYADVDFSSLEQVGNDASNTTLVEVKKLPAGSLSGTVLSVSKSSMEYWKCEENLIETKAIPAFVGADIAGAIVGVCMTGTIQYIRTGTLDGEGLLYAAGGGAITGSTGIVGKLGKWLTKLMNTIV